MNRLTTSTPTRVRTLTTHRIELDITTALGPKPGIDSSLDRVEVALQIGETTKIVRLNYREIEALNQY